MHIINMTPLEKGVYNDHKADHITEPPVGWALIPVDMELPATFPRLSELEAQEVVYQYEVETETGEKVQKEKTILTVTKMSAGDMPEVAEPAPTEMEKLRADVEFLAIMTGVEL